MSNVELKHIDLDEKKVRAIARQAEAERLRPAKIIDAEGELQAAEKLVEQAPSWRVAGIDAVALSRHAGEHRRRKELNN